MVARERRNTDINIWEKRITLWFMAALVTIATSQIVEMNTNVSLIKKDIELSRQKSEKQEVRLDALAADQNQIKLIQNSHEIRLGNVEVVIKEKITTQ